MEQIFQKIPFLRILISLTTGILLARHFSVPLLWIAAVTTVLFIALFYFHLKYCFRFSIFWGITAQLLFAVFGLSLYQNYNQKPVFYSEGQFLATVLEKPIERNKSYKSLLCIKAVKQNEEIKAVNETMLVYFQKSDEVKLLQPGSTIIFKTPPEEVDNFGNPFEFDYKQYLNDRNIYRQVYLNAKSWRSTPLKTKPTFKVIAERTREKLLSIYRRQSFGKNELEILSALTLGYKRELDREVKRVFAAAGAMHILAVSGLHVGILFWMLLLCFGFLQKYRWGRPVFVVISLVILWGYAFITGLSPSVERAAAMFSLFVVGQNIQRRSNIYNTLAATAFIMLLINPNNLFNVGFQLSFAAVFGIVYLQPQLASLYSPKNKIARFIWMLFTVSVSAQLATFPFTSYYFNLFPTFFWLSNMIVIPAVMVLIPLGILLLILSWLPVIPSIISYAINYIIKIVYLVLSAVDQLPYSTQNVSFNNFQMVLIATVLVFVFIAISYPRAHYLKVLLGAFLLFIISSIFNESNQKNHHQMIVYNTPDNPTLQFITGQKNYVVSCSEIKDSDNKMYFISNTCIKQQLDYPVFIHQKPYSDQHFFYKNGVVRFGGKTFILQTNEKHNLSFLSPNFVLYNQNKLPIKTTQSTHLATNTLTQTLQLPAIYNLKNKGSCYIKW